MFGIVNKIFVSLISYHHEISLLCKLRNSSCFFLSKDYTRRVLRSVVIDGSGSFAQISFERLLKTKLTRFFRRHQNKPTLAVRDEIFDRGPVRREQKHFIAGVDNGLKAAEQSLHSAIQNNYVAFMRWNSVLAAQFFRNCGAQLCNTRGGCIARLVLFQCALHCVLNE